MVESYDPQIINEFLTGVASDSFGMMKLMVQVIAVLFSGIILWKVGAMFTARTSKKTREGFMTSRYQKEWKKR